MYRVLERRDMGDGDLKVVFCVWWFFVCFLISIKNFDGSGKVYCL